MVFDTYLQSCDNCIHHKTDVCKTCTYYSRFYDKSLKETLSNDPIAFQCDNEKCKTRIVSSNHKLQDSPCGKCPTGIMKSLDFENNEFKEMDNK